MMAFCPEHPKWDQNPKFTPLSETTSIPTSFICGVLPPGYKWVGFPFKFCMYFIFFKRVKKEPTKVMPVQESKGEFYDNDSLIALINKG